MPEPGDVILADVQFTDSFAVKKRPALVLFQEKGNIIVAGITSNLKMDGIPLTKKEGALKESIIKLNYIFTISSLMNRKILFSLTPQKKKRIYRGLMERFNALSSNA